MQQPQPQPQQPQQLPVVAPLPLLDITLYDTQPLQFAEELRHACHTFGFFLLRHDIPLDIVDQLLEATQDFFQQPLATKLQISYEHNPSFRGYMPLGVEHTAGQVDVREQIEYAVEYPTTTTETTTTTTTNRHSIYERLKARTNPWPENGSLRTSTMDYIPHICRIANCLRESLCLALHLDKHALDPLFRPRSNEVPHWVLKFISYPPAPFRPDDDNDDHPNQKDPLLGVGAHCDTNFITLVLQDTAVGGLQVFSQGEWIDVPSDDGCHVLVCNLGEQAELWSRGYLLATPHRVLLTNRHNCRRRRRRPSIQQPQPPQQQQQPQPRISIPFFYNPLLSAVVQPLPNLPTDLPWHRPLHYDQTLHWRPAKNTVLSTVGENTFKSLARSHPTVFQRHYPDWMITDDGKIIPKEQKREEEEEEDNKLIFH